MDGTTLPGGTNTDQQLPPRSKFMPCRECREPMIVSVQTVSEPRHFECGIKAAVRAMQEMHDKRGPAYDRYRNGMHAYALRLMNMSHPGTLRDPNE